jgi:hypothetical protein
MTKEKCLESGKKLIKEATEKNPKLIIEYTEASRYVICTHEKKAVIPKNLFDARGEWTSREWTINLLRKL